MSELALDTKQRSLEIAKLIEVMCRFSTDDKELITTLFTLNGYIQNMMETTIGTQNWGRGAS